MGAPCYREIGAGGGNLMGAPKFYDMGKLITKELIGTYIHRVLVIDGYLYSRVYGII